MAAILRSRDIKDQLSLYFCSCFKTEKFLAPNNSSMVFSLFSNSPIGSVPFIMSLLNAHLERAAWKLIQTSITRESRRENSTFWRELVLFRYNGATVSVRECDALSVSFAFRIDFVRFLARHCRCALVDTFFSEIKFRDA